MESIEDRYVKNIYRKIIGLALLAHLSYVGIFIYLHVPILTIYNSVSVLFYIWMLWCTRKGYYRLAVSCIHLEVCVFAVIMTVIVGWNIGIVFYLMAMASLTYFCPFEHKQIPYLFALLEIVVSIGLKLYVSFGNGPYQSISDISMLWLYIYNICACFIVVLYAAFSSKVSAVVSRKELQDENQNLTVLANYDQLTGLLNRHAFLTRLEKADNQKITVVLGDIDDFKLINDTWGHTCGDQILSEMADLMRSEIGHQADICRWGGEEFIILFYGLSTADVYTKMQQLCQVIADYVFVYQDGNIHITMTFGMSSNLEGISKEELISLADQRMYRGKSQGKNQVIMIDYSSNKKTESQ